ncbi:hypothetical protein TUN199_07291 [Pyrenophora tritici-repentis]|uniref:Rhodopsin domain-containing protein n=1 Tax=Pyrenophora tritici-repentis TaxID=45151 RepID=A0A2W1EEC9_9PLEO|nr:hypothetical protein A1F99_104670 [Pyrenophora tritici-repentis]KAF7565762.1 hypothetical protein PtrM4_051960 [Pyrenophora tritici-repentis]KAI0574143.1 hypothetical protein Alg215_08771 [Pyrenophora tritici-repentis]KAI0581113.1 hypothetical protein Alg130_06745 [Pyrenophora tritici-repentis]KAI0608447.1 hypothetical protein TUN205_07302 [Pyrenophora tritici-repentis]
MIARQSIKALLLRRAAVDDFLVLISTACVIGLSIIATLLASQGLSDNSLTIEQTHFLMKGYYISNFMYIAAICSAKLSVLVIFYTIVEVQRWARRIVITVSVFVLAWSIASLLAIAIQCDIPRPWIMESNRCFNTQIFWVMYCIIDMSTEVSIVMISVNLVAYIQVPLSQKVAFITCFLPRVLVLGAALIRLIWLYPTTPQSLPEYRLWIPVIISQAQLFLSIATASIPYMVPFFKNLDVNLRTPYLATKRDRLANHRLGPSASSLWFRRSRKPKDLALWDPGAETSAQYKLAPQASPCLPTPRPLTPLSPQVIPSLPNSKSSVRGLNIYIPHRDPQRQRSIDRGIDALTVLYTGQESTLPAKEGSKSRLGHTQLLLFKLGAYSGSSLTPGRTIFAVPTSVSALRLPTTTPNACYITSPTIPAREITDSLWGCEQTQSFSQ